MKQNKINYWLLGTLFLGLVACGDDKGDYIPPAIEEPETPPAEDVYNKPDLNSMKTANRSIPIVAW